MSSLSIAIVGLPNVGKSTLFNALLKKQVALAANYPFATIEPNVGIAEVPDARLAKLAQVVHTTVLKPATVEFVDVAGLVKGASKGEGLGNQFLSHIRETAAICHVLRGFADSEIIREGSVEPVADLDTIRTELYLADLTTLEKQKAPKGASDKAATIRWSAVELLKAALELADRAKLTLLLEDEQVKNTAKELCLLSAKPEIFAVNVAEDELSDSKKIASEFASSIKVNLESVVVISAKVESELSALDEADQNAYMSELGVTQSGLERLAATAYATLGLQSFLTAGELEVRAWTITRGTTAPDAAGVIHTDFKQKFIKVNVASFEEFMSLSGWKGVKDHGKMRVEGKEYVMREGDVVEFMIGS